MRERVSDGEIKKDRERKRVGNGRMDGQEVGGKG